MIADEDGPIDESKFTDIVERLRGVGPDWTMAYNKGKVIPYEVCIEAADEIERLRNNLEVSLKQFEELAWQHAATIERCAQVAAAAIRAMKDKP